MAKTSGGIRAKAKYGFTKEGTKFNTQYGKIVTVIEEGIKKINYKESKFKSTKDMYGFFKDKTLTSQLLGY